jgi:hypothetical protein
VLVARVTLVRAQMNFLLTLRAPLRVLAILKFEYEEQKK